jgi:hypothetical protein
MAHTCLHCGREFETLSQYRLHDCDAEPKKEAERIQFDQFAQLESGPPVVCFTVELERGADTGGKFDMAFAAVSGDEGDPQFAFIDKKNQPIVRLEYDEEVEKFLTQCLETGEYVTAINYENTEYVDEFGREGFLVTGRALGRMFDVTQQEELSASMLETIADIKETLSGEGVSSDEHVQLEHLDEDGLPPLVDLSPDDRVLELGAIDATADDIQVLRDISGFRGEFNRLIVATGLPNQSGRPIQVEPLPEAPAARYLRVGFAGDEATATIVNITSHWVESKQIDLSELLGDDMTKALRDTH